MRKETSKNISLEGLIEQKKNKDKSKLKSKVTKKNPFRLGIYFNIEKSMDFSEKSGLFHLERSYFNKPRISQ